MKGMVNQVFQLIAIGIDQSNRSSFCELRQSFITVLNINTPATISHCGLQHVMVLFVRLK